MYIFQDRGVLNTELNRNEYRLSNLTGWMRNKYRLDEELIQVG